MASSVDERIVAAKFDSSDFEKGVDRTIKKLDELKKSLNFKDAADSVKEMADKTEKSTESMSNSLEKLTNRFTTFTGMLKQKLLSGIADEIVGVFFKIENGIKSLIKSISTDQIGAGMDKYESILTSVRIMMSAGESQAAAYKQIGVLRDYADQTSYSLSQMTDSLSKMRAAGVGLEQATKNVEGIANACAIAGINATDAGRAFYNLSQAYSSGGLKYNDYRSLEMLNMTTEQFKENMLEAAVAAGTLVKTAKGVYKTTNKKDKRVKAGKVVNKDNIRDALNYGFMNKEAMNELFGGKYYFDEDLLKKYKKEAEAAGLTDARQIREYAVKKAKEEYGEVAVNAYLAAREARSLTDSLNTLKDAVSTGWATTFEHLFGKLEDAKEFFTDLVEGELAESIYAIADWRNTVLSYWNAFDAKGTESGGSAFREAILNITDALGVLLKTILQLLPGFDELDDEGEGGQKTLAELGRKLFKFTVNVRNATIKIKEAMWAFNKWMNSPIFDEEGDAPSRIDVIRNAIANLGSVFGIAGKIISIAVTGIAKVLATLYPVFDAVFYAFEKITKPLSDLNSNTKVFDDITMSISNLMLILNPIAKVLSKVIAFLGDVAGFIAGMAIDGFVANISFFADAIGLFVELIFGKSAQLEKGEGILDKIRKDFEGIKEACASGLAAVKEFFTTLISDLRNLFGLTDKSTGEEGGAFAGLKKFFENNQFIKDAKAWVDQAIIDVGNFFKSIPERLKQFGSNIYETIRNLIFKEETKYNGSMLETKTVLTPLGEWLTSTINSIKEFVKSIPNRIIDGVGKIGSWIDTIFNEWFGEKTTKEASDKSAAKAGDKETKQVVTSRFDEFVSGVVSSVGKWFSELPQKIKNAFKNIGDFVSRLFKVIDEFLFGKKINIYVPGGDGKKGKETTVRVKQGFSKFLDGIIKEVKKFIANIPKYIVSGINGIGDFITSIVNAILGRDPATGDSNIAKTVEEKFKEPFKNINLETILEPIKTIGKAIISNIVKIFTGSQDENINLQWLSDKIAEGIEWIRTKASQAFKWVTEFISSIPTRIAAFFTDEATGQQNAGPIGRALLSFGSTVGGFIQDLPSTLLTFFDNAIKAIGDLWDRLYNVIIGEADDATKQIPDDTKSRLSDVVANSLDPEKGQKIQNVKVETKWDEFVKNLGQLIATAFEQLPLWIAHGIDLAILAINNLIANLGNWIGNIGEDGAIAESNEGLVNGIYKNVTQETKEGGDKEEPKLITAIKSIGERIRDLFVNILPTFINQVWTKISEWGSGAWTSIQNIFNGTPETQFEIAIYNFGQKIKEFITDTLPNALKDAFKAVANFVSGFFAKDDFSKSYAGFIESSESSIKSDMLDSMGKSLPSEEDSEKKAEDNKNPFIAFLEKIKEGALDLISNIGPAILNALASVVEWIGKGLSTITNFLNKRDKSESIFTSIKKATTSEESDPAWKSITDALSRFGEALKNLILKIIPGFITEAVNELPNLFNTIIGAILPKNDTEYNEAYQTLTDSLLADAGEVLDMYGILDDDANKVSKGKDEDSGLLGAFNGIGTFLDKIGKIISGDSVLKKIAVIAVVVLLLRQIKEMFSVTDEVGAVSDVLKWGAIIAAIAAIGGIVAWVASLSKDEEAMNRGIKIMDKLKEFLDTFVKLMGIFAVVKLVDFGGDVVDYFTKSSESKGSATGSFWDKLATNGLSSFLGPILGGAGVAVGSNLLSAGTDTLVNTLTDALTTAGQGLEDFLAFVEPFADRLSKMKDKLDKAIENIGLIGKMYASINEMFINIYDDYTFKKTASKKEYKKEETMDDFLKNLQTQINLYIDLTTFIENFARSLKTLEGIEDMSGTFTKMKAVIESEDFAGFLSDMFDALSRAYMSSDMNLFVNGETDQLFSGLSVGLEMLAAALSLFTDSVGGLSIDNIDAFDRALDVFDKLANAFQGVNFNSSSLEKAFTGDNSLSRLGKEMRNFGYYSKVFFGYMKNVDGFDKKNVDETNAKVKAVVDLVEGFSVAAANVAHTGGVQNMSEFADKLPEFGKQTALFINEFSGLLKKDLTQKDVDMASRAIEAAASLAAALGNLGHMSMEDTVDAIWGGLQGEKQSKLIAALYIIYDSIYQAITNEEAISKYESAGGIVAQALSRGIQNAFDDPTQNLQPTITPILDLTTARSQLAEFGMQNRINPTNFAPIVNATVGANVETDQRVLDYTQQLADIHTTIQAMADNSVTVGDITKAFDGMQMILDTNALVGALSDPIDRAIGLKIWKLNRHVTV